MDGDQGFSIVNQGASQSLTVLHNSHDLVDLSVDVTTALETSAETDWHDYNTSSSASADAFGRGLGAQSGWSSTLRLNSARGQGGKLVLANTEDAMTIQSEPGRGVLSFLSGSSPMPALMIEAGNGQTQDQFSV